MSDYGGKTMQVEIITKQESIDKCLKQWEFYAETGTDEKSSYLPAKNIHSSCFFCAYIDILNGLCGVDCPGFKYWAKGRGHCLDDVDTHNNTQISLYVSWRHAQTPKERRLWARRIVWMIWLIKQDNNIQPEQSSSRETTRN